MKKIYLLFALILAVTSVTAQQAVIENPDFEMRNNMTPRITRIELYKDKTLVFMECTALPGGWVAINKFEVLEDADTGERYYPLMLKDNQLGTRITVPNSGKLYFEIVFPPLKEGTKKVNYIDINKDGWAIKGINLKTEKSYKVYESPIYDARNNTMLNVKKIEFFKNKTNVYLEYNGSSFGSVKLDKDLFLEDAQTKKQYTMIDMYGARFGESVQLPANGKTDFVLVYPAVDPAHKLNLRVDNAVKWAVYGLRENKPQNIYVVDNPAYESVNNEWLRVKKVELTDDYTKLYLEFKREPGAWVKFGGGSFLEDTDTKARYKPLFMDGADFEDKITVPSSGVVNVTILYPPVSKTTKKVNYRYDDPNSMSIHGIKIR